MLLLTTLFDSLDCCVSAAAFVVLCYVVAVVDALDPRLGLYPNAAAFPRSFLGGALF